MSYITAITGTMPSRTDSQEDFSDHADALVGSLPTFQSQINTVVDEINANVDAVETDRLAVVGLKSDVEGLKADCQTIHGNCETVQGLSEAARDLAEGYKDGAFVAAAAAQAAAGLPSLAGNAEYVLGVNATADGVEWKQVFKPDSIVELPPGSTSWTCPAGVKLARLRLAGGAGGGGTGNGTTVTQTAGAGPAEVEALVDLTPGTTYAYAIGAGGAGGGTTLSTPGSSGGTTSITIGTTTYTAGGGGGGVTDQNFSIPGKTGTNGVLKKGNPGTPGFFAYGSRHPVLGATSASLGITGGSGSMTNGTDGDDGRIILELYK
ncbi:MAG: hypothetical protein EOL92_00430 [Bacteroidia bacterium]|nr:hypothetical protein [Bacteroidia bacterium]